MRLLLAGALVAFGLLTGCSSATTDAAQAPVPTALPTLTPPTATPLPTATPVPTATPPPTATPVPTATSLPTATPVPQADPGEILNEFGVELLSNQPECSALFDRRLDYPPRLERTCSELATVLSPAGGIVVGVGSNDPEAALDFTPNGAPATEPDWAWTDLHAMASYVIVDHGLIGSYGNVTSITWGIEPSADIGLGTRLAADVPVGTSVAGQPIRWQLWTGDDLFGAAEASQPPPPFETALAIADGLRPLMAAPVQAPCSVSFAAPSDLPNAGRPYRFGTHRGVDMICGAPGNPTFAALDGTVVAVVNDYDDSPVQPRLDVLNNAAIGGGTPHWTLNLLFGNFVVIEHTDPDGREVLTISAHMERVEPEIVVGHRVSAGDLLGEVGNRGTGASAAGTTPAWDRSRHLHWEMFVDGAYLGANLDTAQTAAVYRSLLCGAAAMNGC